MGKVIVIYKIYPEDVDSIEKIKNNVKGVVGKHGEYKDMKEEPLAFGMSLIRVMAMFDQNNAKAVDNLEEALKKMEGVSEVEVEGMNLI